MPKMSQAMLFATLSEIVHGGEKGARESKQAAMWRHHGLKSQWQTVAKTINYNPKRSSLIDFNFDTYIISVGRSAISKSDIYIKKKRSDLAQKHRV